MSLFAKGRLPRALLFRPEILQAPSAPLSHPVSPAFSASRASALSQPAAPATSAPSARFAAPPNALSGAGIFFLSVFLFFLFSRVLDFGLNSLHLPLVFSTICLLIALVSGFQRALQLQAMQLLLAFTVWMLICTPFSVWRGGSVELLRETWSKSLMAGFIVAALVQTSAQSLRIMKTLAFAFLAAGALGLIVGESMDGRLMLAVGSYSNPNDYAVAIIYGCVTWYFMMHSPRHSFFLKVFSAGVILFLLFMLLKTGSRGAMIAACLTFVPVFARYRASTKLVVAIALPSILAIGLVALPPEMRSRYLTFFSSESIEKAKTVEEQEFLIRAQGSSQQRLQLAKDAILLTFQNPIFGVGPGMYSAAQNDLSIARSQPKGAWLGTHNTYLEVSSETGFPGFIIYMACLLVCWRDLRRLERATAARRDPQAQEVQTLAFTMRLLLLSSLIFFFFEHIPFSPFVPVITCWIAAFSRAASNEMQLQAGLERPAPRAARAPVPAWAR